MFECLEQKQNSVPDSIATFKFAKNTEYINNMKKEKKRLLSEIALYNKQIALYNKQIKETKDPMDIVNYKLSILTNKALIKDRYWDIKNINSNIFFVEQHLSWDDNDIRKKFSSKYEDIDIIMPNVLLTKNIETIKNNILWNIECRSPSDLFVKIADHIKDNISYDFLQALNKDDWTLLRAQGYSLTNDWIKSLLKLKNSSNKQFYYFFNYISKNQNDSEKVKRYIVDMIRICSWPLNITWLNDAQILTEKSTRKSTLDFLLNLWRKVDTSYYDRDVEAYDLLYKTKVWVCRNFSMLAKVLYNYLAPYNFQNTYCAYVGTNNHAYNMLIEEWIWWNIITKRFDITRYISQSNLYYDKEKNQSLEWNESIANNKNYLISTSFT